MRIRFIVLLLLLLATAAITDAPTCLNAQSRGRARSESPSHRRSKPEARTRTEARTKSGSRKKEPPPPPRPDIRMRLSRHAQYSFTFDRRGRWAVHTLTADLDDPSIRLELGKGLENVSGLERVADIMHRFDSVRAGTMNALAGVNANFWRAGTNLPIGPTVLNGIVLTSERNKNWSSVAVTTKGDIVMDRHEVSTEVRTRFGSIPVDHFNRRHDSTSVVVYTELYGASVPFIDTARIFQASADTITDDSESDVITSGVDSIYSRSAESGLLKVQFRYLTAPLVNTLTPCRITAVDTGIVEIPRGGGVISFGKGRFPLFFSLFAGDTFSLVTRLAPVVNDPVRVMSGGTPRLVRDGAVSVEWQEEGNRKRRFVTGQYARTAIGVTRDRRRIIFVTVEAPNRHERRRGIALPDLAKLLIQRGAWQAMNFDGGGSATMVIGENTVAPATGTRYSRKISTSLMLVQKSTVTTEPAQRKGG